MANGTGTAASVATAIVSAVGTAGGTGSGGPTQQEDVATSSRRVAYALSENRVALVTEASRIVDARRMRS